MGTAPDTAPLGFLSVRICGVVGQRDVGAHAGQHSTGEGTGSWGTVYRRSYAAGRSSPVGFAAVPSSTVGLLVFSLEGHGSLSEKKALAHMIIRQEPGCAE